MSAAPKPPSAKPTRAERLAAALRANLKRRKAATPAATSPSPPPKPAAGRD
jgi:hypothetical protein